MIVRGRIGLKYHECKIHTIRLSVLPSSTRDKRKLLELGVPESIVVKLDDKSAKELLKNLLYAIEMARDEDGSQRTFNTETGSTSSLRWQ